ELAKPLTGEVARGKNFADVIFNERGIFHSGLRGNECEHIHAEWRLRFAQPFHVFGVGKKTATAHAGHSVDLRKRAADEEIRIMPNSGQQGDAAEFEVGFVDEDGGVRGCVEDPLKKIMADCASSRVVGIRNKDGPRFGTDRSKKLIYGKIEVIQEID